MLKKKWCSIVLCMMMAVFVAGGCSSVSADVPDVRVLREMRAREEAKKLKVIAAEQEHINNRWVYRIVFAQRMLEGQCLMAEIKDDTGKVVAAYQTQIPVPDTSKNTDSFLSWEWNLMDLQGQAVKGGLYTLTYKTDWTTVKKSSSAFDFRIIRHRLSPIPEKSMSISVATLAAEDES